MNQHIIHEQIKEIEKYRKEYQITSGDLEAAIGNILSHIDDKLERYTNRYPSPCSTDNRYDDIDNSEWTTSFWTGMLWLAYEYTGDEKYRRVAEIQVLDFKKRIQEKYHVDTHDLGFLYTLSCVSGYKLTGNEDAREAALLAADHLLTRYHEKAEVIQAWGDLSDLSQKGRMIIDCNMNLPLLYWASEVTKNDKYRDVAIAHVNQAKKYTVRNDASTYHTYYMDVNTGEPLYGKTHQGYSDESCWARGQAWGIYGFPLSYREGNEDESLLDLSNKLTNYFLNRLPEDYVCYWDLIFNNQEDVDQPRDSSSTAIAVCGILENLKKLPEDYRDRKFYENAVNSMMRNLIDKYASKDTKEDGILHHSMYSYHENNGIDEFCIWGDYFYFEALIRMSRDWAPYWR